MRGAQFYMLKTATDVGPLCSFHTTMFHATLILGVGVVFIVQNPTDNAIAPPPEANPTPEEINLANFMLYSKWMTSISLTVTVICLSVLATMSRSLDKAGSLKITNRYLRLLPRLGLIAVAICLPIDNSMRGNIFLGILVAMLASCLFWEWYASLESDGGIFEP